MPKVTVHPHPTMDIHCRDCKYWHPATDGEYAMGNAQGPFGSPIPTKSLIAMGQGMVGMITGRMASCFRFPRWEPVHEDHYCGEYTRVMERAPVPKG